MKNAITTTTKLVNIIARFTIKHNGAVVYQVRSSKGTDIYTTTLVNGKATGCSCPAVKPCYGLLSPPTKFTTLSLNDREQRNEQAHQDHRWKQKKWH